MTGSNSNRLISFALLVALSATVTTAGTAPDPPQLPPEFVAPPTGIAAPVFVPTQKAPVVQGAATNSATFAIVTELDAARNLCQRTPSPEYNIDCLGDQLQAIARELPSTGDYADAKRILDETAGQLRSLAKANASQDLPTGRIRSRSDPNVRSNTALTPVATDRLAATNERALEILAEAETLLLRSTANSAARKVHYQRISTALGSNKALLRST